MDDDDDDDREFLAAARRNDALVARLLIRLSRSQTYVPQRQLLLEFPKRPLPSGETEDAIVEPTLMPPARAWGRRRARSAPVAAEGAPAAKTEEEAGRASPATPLSWNGASGTSGSGSEDGRSAPPRPQKRRRRRAREPVEPGQPPQPAWKAVRHGGEEQIGAPPAEGTAPGSCGIGGPARVRSSDQGGQPHGVSVIWATAAGGSPAGSCKVTRQLGPPRSVVYKESSKSRFTGERTNSGAFGRQRKKKTVLELRAMWESLLREQEQLQKELGKHRGIYDALLEENMALKKLESSLPSLRASKPTLVCGEAKSEELQQMQPASEGRALEGVGTAYVVHDEDSPEQPYCTSSSSSVPARPLLFDLNCLPDGDL